MLHQDRICYIRVENNYYSKKRKHQVRKYHQSTKCYIKEENVKNAIPVENATPRY